MSLKTLGNRFSDVQIITVPSGTVIADDYVVDDETAVTRGSFIFCTSRIYNALKRRLDDEDRR